MKRKWKKVLGACILFAPVAVLVGVMVWEDGVIYALVHFALALVAIAAVLVYVAIIGLLFDAFTMDDAKDLIRCPYDMLIELLEA